MKRAIMSWSGGKDSCLALQRAKEFGVEIVALITAMDESSMASRSNGVSKDILLRQADALGIPIICFPTSWHNYEERLILNLSEAKEKYQLDCCVFGDIDIIRHREFEEHASAKAGLQAILPLWGEERKELAYDVIESGIKAKISVIRRDLIPERLLGANYDNDFLDNIKRLGNVDICGENGEFHTLVYDSPSFSQPIVLETEKIEESSNYMFCRLKLKVKGI